MPATQGTAQTASLRRVHDVTTDVPEQLEHARHPPRDEESPEGLHVEPRTHESTGGAQIASLVDVHALTIEVDAQVEHTEQLLGVDVPVRLHVDPATQGPEQTGWANPPAHVQPAGHAGHDGGDKDLYVPEAQVHTGCAVPPAHVQPDEQATHELPHMYVPAEQTRHTALAVAVH